MRSMYGNYNMRFMRNPGNMENNDVVIDFQRKKSGNMVFNFQYIYILALFNE